MPPITKQQLEFALSQLQALQPWADYSIGYAYGGTRLESMGGSIDISDRGTKRQTYDYIRAMLQALRSQQMHDSFNH